ncbi:hypothetical protein FR742_18595 [Nonomuraea sp. C10]|nr:hypothetical protein FR742_18595 [Nonomuraea sp. C10]
MDLPEPDPVLVGGLSGRGRPRRGRGGRGGRGEPRGRAGAAVAAGDGRHGGQEQGEVRARNGHAESPDDL